MSPHRNLRPPPQSVSRRHRVSVLVSCLLKSNPEISLLRGARGHASLIIGSSGIERSFTAVESVLTIWSKQ